jgi:hypothetical protein
VRDGTHAEIDAAGHAREPSLVQDVLCLDTGQVSAESTIDGAIAS